MRNPLPQQNDVTENFTFLQLRWQAVKMAMGPQGLNAVVRNYEVTSPHNIKYLW